MRQQDQIIEELLVMQAQAGDKGALSQLVKRRGRRMLAHATRLLGNIDQAQDAVQDAWMDIAKGLPRLKEPRAFRVWSLCIVTRRCAKHIKTAQRQRKLTQNYAQEQDTHAAEQGPTAAENAGLRQAILQLPPKQAAAMALVYLDDLSLAEASAVLEVPLGTVKSRLMTARETLRNSLNGE